MILGKMIPMFTVFEQRGREMWYRLDISENDPSAYNVGSSRSWVC